MPKLSIIIGAKEAQNFIEECLDSIQNQTAFCCKNPIDYEILLGIDGCVKTLSTVLSINDKYKKLNVFWMPENKGVYITKNTLLQFVTGTHILTFDADDIMFPNMVENLFKLTPPLIIKHDGIQFHNSDIFKITGGFMPWRCAADTEHLNRVKRIIGRDIVRTDYMYTYRQHSGQITKNTETNTHSKTRREYSKLIESNIIPTTINPVLHDVYMSIDSDAFKNYKIPSEIHVGIASFPARVKSLEQTVKSLYNQVDYLHVYLNNYLSIPDFLNKPNIKTYLSSDYFGDLGDVGKFFAFVDDKIQTDAYLLTADDDIIYNDNYVSHIISGINLYNRKAIISFHGRNFINYPVNSYYKDPAVYYPCFKQNKSNVPVHFAGTGVMGWHNSTISFILQDFTYSNMADIFVSILAHKLNIPLIVLKHNANIVTESKFYNQDHSICRVSVHDDEIQTQTVNQASHLIIKKLPSNKLRHLKHVITTRLIYDDKKLLDDRIKLTQDILIPCLKAQTCKNFTLAIRCYDADVELLKSKLDFPFVNFESYVDYLQLCKDENYQIQTRHDSDDYMSDTYIEFIQQQVLSKHNIANSFLLQFQPDKLDYQSLKILPLSDYTDTLNSGFLTLYQQVIKYSIYEKAHTEMYKIVPLVFTYPKGFVKYFIHGKNNSLLPLEVRLKTNKF
jgi:glycosyltransferase involved in cell wall biosynthesis